VIANAGISMLALPVSTARDHIRGPQKAPVTVVEYGDYQCPFCAAAHDVVNELQARAGDKVCFVFRHFPLTTVHPRAQIAAEAAESAGAQGMFWGMHDMLYKNQQCLEDTCLTAYAQALRLNMLVFHADLAKHRHLPKVREDFMSGVRSGVNGTPSFYLNGIRHDGPWEIRVLLAAVQRATEEAAVR
jgi:protein-disulfide isomerase